MTTGSLPIGADRDFSTWRFALILLALVLVSFPSVFFGGQTFFYRDFCILTYPYAQFHQDSFWNGELPFWNPFNNCGVPCLAQYSLSLYPFSLFYLLLPLSWSLPVFCLAHLYLAGFGAYRLVTHWTGNRWAAAVAGVGMTFNGLCLSDLMWPTYCACWGWMPWVVLFTERAWQEGRSAIVKAAVVGALQMLAFVPELILLTWTLLLAMNLGQVMEGRSPRWLIMSRFVAVVLLITGHPAAR